MHVSSSIFLLANLKHPKNYTKNLKYCLHTTHFYRGGISTLFQLKFGPGIDYPLSTMLLTSVQWRASHAFGLVVGDLWSSIRFLLASPLLR